MQAVVRSRCRGRCVEAIELGWCDEGSSLMPLRTEGGAHCATSGFHFGDLPRLMAGLRMPCVSLVAAGGAGVTATPGRERWHV